MEGGVGPSTSSSHSRPVRSSSRFYYNNNNNNNINININNNVIGNGNGNHSSSFTGPVRRWEKKWVHVLSSLKARKQSNAPNPDNKSSLLLCKWTPLSDSTSADIPHRKFRYTPIAVFEDGKKLAARRIMADAESEEIQQPAKRNVMDTDDVYGMLDINHDLMGAHEEASKSVLTQYSRRSHVNVGLYLENQKTDMF